MTGETRSQTIIRHTQKYLHESSDSMPTFAIRVVEEYHRRVEGRQREITFQVQGDAYRCARLNAQELRRMMDGEIRLPVDLEEAWVHALPEAYRWPLVSDLAARYGLLPAVIPTGEGAEGAVHVARLAKEFGEAMQALAPMLENGVIDERDVPHAKHALRQLNELIGAATTLVADVTAILPERAVVRPLRGGA